MVMWAMLHYTPVPLTECWLINVSIVKDQGSYILIATELKELVLQFLNSQMNSLISAAM